MMYRLNTSKEKKLFVGGLFAVRVVVPIMTVVKLYYLQDFFEAHDRTWEMVNQQVWTQVIMNLSIITACIPSLGSIIWDVSRGFRSASATITTDLEHSRKPSNGSWSEGSARYPSYGSSIVKADHDMAIEVTDFTRHQSPSLGFSTNSHNSRESNVYRLPSIHVNGISLESRRNTIVEDGDSQRSTLVQDHDRQTLVIPPSNTEVEVDLAGSRKP